MPQYVLGISAFYHDSAAALLCDGEIVAAAQEERFTRKKHDPGFPSKAAEFCFAQAGIQASDLDFVAFYDKPILKFHRLLETYLAFAPVGLKSFRKAIPTWLGEKLHMKGKMTRALGCKPKNRYVFPEHHESHAASAFYPSPFEEAAIVTMDLINVYDLMVKLVREKVESATGVPAANVMVTASHNHSGPPCKEDSPYVREVADKIGRAAKQAAAEAQAAVQAAVVPQAGAAGTDA